MTSISHQIVDLCQDGRIRSAENLYQHVSWLDAVAEGNGYQYRGLCSRCREGEVLSIFYTARRGLFRLAGSPLPASFCDHIPPFADSGLSSRLKTRILLAQMRFLAQQGYDYVECRLPDTYLPDDPILKSPRTRVRRVGTLILDLTVGEDRLWRNMQGRSRNMVRKALKNEVTVRVFDGNAQDVDLFYEMLRKTYIRQGLSVPHRRSLYRALIRRLASVGRVFWVGAEVAGTIEAMGLFPHDRNEIHFLSGTSTPTAMRLGANNLLQWEVIRYGVSQGLQRYDLGGTGVASIDRFKQSIGGVPMSYHRIGWFSPSAHLAERIREGGKPLLSRLAGLRASFSSGDSR